MYVDMCENAGNSFRTKFIVLIRIKETLQFIYKHVEIGVLFGIAEFNS
jgi:hypothetical protein